MRIVTAYAEPSAGPVEIAMEWTREGLAEIERVLERYPGTDGRSNDSYRYLRVKLHAYTRLRRVLRSLVPLGRTALLRALLEFRLDPSDAQGEGEDVLSLVRERVNQVVSVLKGYLSAGVRSRTRRGRSDGGSRRIRISALRSVQLPKDPMLERSFSRLPFRRR